MAENHQPGVRRTRTEVQLPGAAYPQFLADVAYPHFLTDAADPHLLTDGLPTGATAATGLHKTHSPARQGGVSTSPLSQGSDQRDLSCSAHPWHLSLPAQEPRQVATATKPQQCWWEGTSGVLWACCKLGMGVAPAAAQGSRALSVFGLKTSEDRGPARTWSPSEGLRGFSLSTRTDPAQGF